MNIVTLIKDLATLLTLVFGTAWTLYIFGIHRVRQPAVKIVIARTAVHDGGSYRSVVLEFTASNLGKTGVEQNMCWAEVAPLTGPPAGATDVTSGQARIGGSMKSYAVFRAHTFLEPGEEFRDGLLLYVPVEVNSLRVKVVFSALKPDKIWFSQAVILADPDSK